VKLNNISLWSLARNSKKDTMKIAALVASAALLLVSVEGQNVSSLVTVRAVCAKAPLSGVTQ
jgi:hypothetical protein